MAGTAHFKNGKHASRLSAPGVFEDDGGLRGEIEQVAGVRLATEEYQRLVFAISLAKASQKRELQFTPSRDTAAELIAMGRLKDDTKLLDALCRCTAPTYVAIAIAQSVLISDVIWSHGRFVDSEGCEFRFAPPSIEFVQYRSEGSPPPYLPAGMDGIRESIARAKKEISRGKRGRRPKLYMEDLAKECLCIWRKCTGESKPAAWFSAEHRTASGIVVVAEMVFHAAGIKLSRSRITDLMKASLKKSN